MNRDRSSLSPHDFLAFIIRNMEPGAHIVREDSGEGEGFVRLEENAVPGASSSKWFPASVHGLSPLLTRQSVVVEAVSEDGQQVLVSFPESSYTSFGYAVPVRRLRARRQRMAIRESTDAIKDQIRGNRALLRHFILLSDEYRKNPQLNSKEAQAAMQSLMRGLWDSGSGDLASSYGAVEFEPDTLAWVGLFDTIGEQTLAQFLGIQSVAEIPGADLEQRTSEIMADADADAIPPDEPEKILAGYEYPKANLVERGRKIHASQNHMSRYYYRMKA